MVCSLDLEMNQPSGRIIQIGCVFGDLLTGVIWEKISLLVNPDEAISPFITQLTSITQEMVDTAPTLLDQYVQLQEAFHRHAPARNPITWGGGDSVELRDQVALTPEDFLFGRRWTDVKTIYQTWRFSQGKPIQGGLSKALVQLGLQFHGRKHWAPDDAENTFRLHLALLKKFRA